MSPHLPTRVTMVLPVDASFALNHPEKVVDFGYRAVHELAMKSKAISVAFYGSPPRRAYWNGCSTGGRQGLTEAQRYPTDFDGIIAGAPANYMTRLSAKYVAASQVIHKDPGNFVPEDKLKVLHAAVLAQCDALDGVKDGVIENPLSCDFDPASLAVHRCRSADVSFRGAGRQRESVVWADGQSAHRRHAVPRRVAR